MNIFKGLSVSVFTVFLVVTSKVSFAQCEEATYRIDVQNVSSFDLSIVNSYENICVYSSVSMNKPIAFEFLNTIEDYGVRITFDASLKGLEIDALSTVAFNSSTINVNGAITIDKANFKGFYYSNINVDGAAASLTINTLDMPFISQYNNNLYVSNQASLNFTSDVSLEDFYTININNAFLNVDGVTTIGKVNTSSNFSTSYGSVLKLKSGLKFINSFVNLQGSDVSVKGNITFENSGSNVTLNKTNLTVGGDFEVLTPTNINVFGYTNINVAGRLNVTEAPTSGYVFNYYGSEECVNISANKEVFPYPIGSSPYMNLCGWAAAPKYPGNATATSALKSCSICAPSSTLDYSTYFYVKIGDTLELTGQFFPIDYTKIQLKVVSSGALITPISSNGKDKIKIIVPSMGNAEQLALTSGGAGFAYIYIDEAKVTGISANKVVSGNSYWVYGNNLLGVKEVWSRNLDSEGKYIYVAHKVLDNKYKDRILISANSNLDCRSQIGAGRPYTSTSTFNVQTISSWYGGFMASKRLVNNTASSPLKPGTFNYEVSNACPNDTIVFDPAQVTYNHDHTLINDRNSNLKIIGNGMAKTQLVDVNLEQDYSAITFENAGNVSFDNLTFRESISYQGGSVFNISGTTNVSIANTEFYKNQSYGDGGVIYIKKSETGYDVPSLETTKNVQFTSNTAGQGGAIYVSDADISLKNTIFKGNKLKPLESSASGGAVCLKSYSYTNNIVFDDVRFENNGDLSNTNGGALSLDYTSFDACGLSNGSSLKLLSCYFEGNNGLEGGAINNNNYHIEYNTTTFTSNASKYSGGAVYSYTESGVPGTKPAFVKSTFSSNISNEGSGGALYLEEGSSTTSTLDLKNITFIGNKSPNRNGGAIYSQFPINVDSCTMNQNQAFDGGAIYLSDDNWSNYLYNTINNSVFNNNSASNDGGVIKAMINGDYMYVNSSNFSDNSAENNGGAIYADKAYYNSDSCSFVSNTAKNSGGAIYLNADYTGGFSNGRALFQKNKAGVSGGALYLTSYNGNYYIIDKSSFIGNTSDIDGGAIWSNKDLNISKTSLLGNKALRNGGAFFRAGGGYYAYTSYFRNVTLAENTANEGAGIYAETTEMDFNNSAIGKNISSSGNSDIYLYPESASLYSSGNNVFVDTSGIGSGLEINDVVSPGGLYLEKSLSTSGNQSFKKPLSISPLIDRMIFYDEGEGEGVEGGRPTANNVTLGDDRYGIDQINSPVYGAKRDAGAIELQDYQDPNYITTTVDDAIVGSIRGAEIFNKFHEESDTISFSPTLVNKKIELLKSLVFSLDLDPNYIESLTEAKKLRIDAGNQKNLIGLSTEFVDQDMLEFYFPSHVLGLQIDGSIGGTSKNGSGGVVLNEGAENSVLDGLIIKNNETGVQVKAGNITIKNSTIYGNSRFGILLESSEINAGSIIQGNRIGTTENNEKPVGINHALAGLAIAYNNVLIGGSKVSERNIIAGNDNIGLVIASSGNQVYGNLIGISASGSALPNIIGIDFAATQKNPIIRNNKIGNQGAFNTIANNRVGINMPSVFEEGTSVSYSNNQWSANNYANNDTVIKLKSGYQYHYNLPTIVNFEESDSVIIGYAKPGVWVYLYLDSTSNATYFVDSVWAGETGFFTFDLKTKSNLPKLSNFTLMQNQNYSSSPLSLAKPIGCDIYRDSLGLDTSYAFCYSGQDIGEGKLSLTFDKIKTVNWYIGENGSFNNLDKDSLVLDIINQDNIPSYFAKVSLDNGCVLNSDTVQVNFYSRPTLDLSVPAFASSSHICADSASELSIAFSASNPMSVQYSYDNSKYAIELEYGDSIVKSPIILKSGFIKIDTAFDKYCAADISISSIAVDVLPKIKDTTLWDCGAGIVLDETVYGSLKNVQLGVVSSGGVIKRLGDTIFYGKLAGNAYVKENLSGCNVDFELNVKDGRIAITQDSISNVNCRFGADGYAAVSATSLQEMPSYLWSNGVAVSVVSNLKAGSHKVIASTSNGCKDSLTVEISEPLIGPFVNPTIDQTICLGSSTQGVQFTGSTGTSFKWVNDNNTLNIPASGEGGILSFTANNLGATQSVATIIVTPYNLITACKGKSDTFKIVVNPLPVISILASSDSVCFGDSVKLTASGASIYSWSNALSNDVYFTPDSTSKFYVTGIDVNACSNTDSIEVVVNSLPVISATASASDVCKGDSIILNGGGASSYVWGSGVKDNIAFPLYVTQDFIVEGTDANGCKAKDTINIVANGLAAGDHIAFDEYFTIIEDFRDTFKINTNFPNTQQLALEYSVITNPSKGLATVSNDSIVFVPNANSNGLDSIQIRVTDGTCKIDTAIVYVTITPVNDAHLATSGIKNHIDLITSGATGTTSNLLSNYFDVDNDTLEVDVLSISYLVLGAIVIYNTDSSMSYTAPAGLTSGTVLYDTVRFNVCDTQTPRICVADTFYVSIVISPKLSVTLSPIPAIVCLGDSINIKALVKNASSNTSFTWTNVASQTVLDTDSSLDIKTSLAGNLTLKLTVQDPNLDAFDTTFTVKVNQSFALTSTDLLFNSHVGVDSVKGFTSYMELFTCIGIDYTFVDANKIITWESNDLSTGGVHKFTVSDKDTICSVTDSVSIMVNSTAPRSLPLIVNYGPNVLTQKPIVLDDFGRITSVLVTDSTELGKSVLSLTSESLVLDYTSDTTLAATDVLKVVLTDVCGTSKEVELIIALENTIPFGDTTKIVEFTINEKSDLDVEFKLLAIDPNKNQKNINVLKKEDYPYLSFRQKKEFSSDYNDSIVVSLNLKVIADSLPLEILNGTKDSVHIYYEVCDTEDCSKPILMILRFKFDTDTRIDYGKGVLKTGDFDIVMLNNAVSNGKGLKYEFQFEGEVINTDSVSYDLSIMSRWGDVVYQEKGVGNHINWKGDYMLDGAFTGQKVEDGNYFWIISVKYLNEKDKVRSKFLSGYLYYVDRYIEGYTEE